jgi:hypothetical protein
MLKPLSMLYVLSLLPARSCTPLTHPKIKAKYKLTTPLPATFLPACVLTTYLSTHNSFETATTLSFPPTIQHSFQQSWNLWLHVAFNLYVLAAIFSVVSIVGGLVACGTRIVWMRFLGLGFSSVSALASLLFLLFPLLLRPKFLCHLVFLALGLLLSSPPILRCVSSKLNTGIVGQALIANSSQLSSSSSPQSSSQ